MSRGQVFTYKFLKTTLLKTLDLFKIPNTSVAKWRLSCFNYWQTGSENSSTPGSAMSLMKYKCVSFGFLKEIASLLLLSQVGYLLSYLKVTLCSPLFLLAGPTPCGKMRTKCRVEQFTFSASKWTKHQRGPGSCSPIDRLLLRVLFYDPTTTTPNTLQSKRSLPTGHLGHSFP